MGALVRGPWFIVRAAVDPHEMLAWYEADVAPAEAAARVVQAWLAHLSTPGWLRERIREQFGADGVTKFEKLRAQPASGA